MGARLGDLADYFSPGLELTVKGKTYTVPLPSAELGLWCRTVAEAAGTTTDDSDEEAYDRVRSRLEALPELPGEMTLTERLLGPAYEQMRADKVEDPYIEFCTATAYIWVMSGEEAAERYWTSGGRPEALRPANRAQKRAEARTGGPSTGAATATLSPASTSGTTSRPRSGRRRRPR